VLIEKVVRGVSPDTGSGIKYICAALAVMAAYDIILLLSTSSSARVVADFWTARGFVNLLAALPIGIAAGRTSFDLVVDKPRPAPTRSLSLALIGGFIGLWMIVDFFVTTFGVSWTNVATIVLITAAIVVVSTVLISDSPRAKARVYLTKVFFRYKYDYRKEWLRFIAILSESGLENVPRTAVRAVAPIVNSPGGIVWTQEDQGDVYLPIGAWRCELPVSRSISPDSSLIRVLRDRQWVIDLNEMKAQPKRYGDLQLDPWFTEQEEFWLIVPLMIGRQLLGLIVLLRPNVVPTLNFEDHDLLRTVGRHVATHIRQAESDRRLAETSQFGTYHRLSAFLMHDLNNLIAQQSLVVKNAEKFRHNPKFVDDTIDTIAASVSRMRRLMEQLSRNSTAPTKRRVNIHDVIAQAVIRSEPRQPAPVLALGDGDAHLDADPERLTGIIEHLIRNAQDATAPDGRIEISTGEDGGVVVVRIENNGCGMSPEFVSERLFRPFDSTKGVRVWESGRSRHESMREFSAVTWK
jgi:putative PEP-CTERM system histidine kinase